MASEAGKAFHVIIIGAGKISLRSPITLFAGILAQGR